jgi:hypothetical protein
MAAPKGVRPPNAGKGRPAGSVNRTSKDAKAAIARFVDGNSDRLQGWLDRIAKKNPQAAFGCVIALLEYHLPKLGRVEHTGDGGGPVIIQSTPVDEAL